MVWHLAVTAEVQHRWKLRVCAGSHTKYPSLTSSGVTAALLTLSLGLGPPPRLKTECTVLQSREEEGLLDRTPDEEEAAVAEALVAPGCQLGSMTVLMTELGEEEKINKLLQ